MEESGGLFSNDRSVKIGREDCRYVEGNRRRTNPEKRSRHALPAVTKRLQG